MVDLPTLSPHIAQKLPRVLLASRSPRRTWLLDAAGVRHSAEHPGFEDSQLAPAAGLTDAAWVCSLAYLKAWVITRALLARDRLTAPDSEIGFVIGADTACSMDGKLIGTPQTAQEAEAMIRAFMGRRHEVITGVAIIEVHAGAATRRHLFADRASVKMGHLDDKAISRYIATNDWRGKAGAYNLLDRMEAGWPLTYQGDATTVMGLPMTKLLGRLADLVALPPFVPGTSQAAPS